MIFNKNNIFTSEFSLLAKQNHKVILIHHLKCGVSLENLDLKCFYKDLNVYQTHLCFCAHYQCHSNLNAKNTQITPTRCTKTSQRHPLLSIIIVFNISKIQGTHIMLFILPFHHLIIQSILLVFLLDACIGLSNFEPT